MKNGDFYKLDGVAYFQFDDLQDKECAWRGCGYFIFDLGKEDLSDGKSGPML